MKVSAINLGMNTQQQLSFKGKAIKDKNPAQFLSFAPEHGGLKKIGLNNYVEGGLACVAQEAPESWVKNGADIRSFVPYHAPNNPQGKLIVATIDKAKHLVEKQNIIPDLDSGNPAEATVFTEAKKRFNKASGITNNTIATVQETYPEYLHQSQMRYVDQNYVLKKGEHFVAVNPDKTKSGFFKYALLEDTGIKGSITALKENALEKEQIPYRILKYVDKTGKPDLKKDAKYFVHTPQVAVMPKAYGKGLAYAPGQIIGSWWDLYY